MQKLEERAPWCLAYIYKDLSTLLTLDTVADGRSTGRSLPTRCSAWGEVITGDRTGQTSNFILRLWSWILFLDFCCSLWNRHIGLYYVTCLRCLPGYGGSTQRHSHEYMYYFCTLVWVLCGCVYKHVCGNQDNFKDLVLLPPSSWGLDSSRQEWRLLFLSPNPFSQPKIKTFFSTNFIMDGANRQMGDRMEMILWCLKLTKG